MPLPQRPTVRRNRIGMAIAISILAHALILPLVARDGMFRMPKVPKRQVVSLVTTPRSGVQHAPSSSRDANSPNAWSKDQRPELPKALEPEQPKQPDKIDGQVVSLGQPQDERAPDKPTKYLSEHDSRVAKETRAKETSAFFKNALSKVQKEGKNVKAGEARAAPEPKPGEDGQGGGSVPERSKQALELPNRQRRDALHIEPGKDGTVANRDANDATRGGGKRVAMAESQQQASPGNQAPGVPGLAPGAPGKAGPLKLTLDNPLMNTGPVAGGPMPDDLRGVEEGDETLLNSRSFKYAGFLNRVKETVGRVWTQRVNDEASKRDPSGQLFSFRDRRTVVDFTLNKDGEIIDVRVATSCGVPYLDEVAVESFRIVHQFPNPPPGLLGPTGSVKLPFAFTLLAAQGGMRMQFGPAYLPNSPAARGF